MTQSFTLLNIRWTKAEPKNYMDKPKNYLDKCETLPTHPPPPHYLSQSSNHFTSYPAGDQLMAEGVTHISWPTQEYDRGRQEKIEG